MGGLSPQPPGERKVHENAFPQGAESHSVEHGLEELLVPCLGSSSNKAMDHPTVCHNCLTDENTGLRDQRGRVTTPKPHSGSGAKLKYQFRLTS